MQKLNRRQVIRWIIPFLLIAALFLCCSADGEQSHDVGDRESKEKMMALYRKIFADYQLSSFQEQKLTATGQLDWLAAPSDSADSRPPILVLVTDKGIAAQYPEKIEWIGLDGVANWSKIHDSGMNILIFDSSIYFRDPDQAIYALDRRGNYTLADFFVPTSDEDGTFYTVLPKEDGYILVHGFVPAREERMDEEDDSDRYSLVLKGPEGFDDYKYMRYFEGESLRGLLTKDEKLIVLLNDQGEVTSYDMASGKPSRAFKIEGAEFIEASLDREDRLILVMKHPEDGTLLACYDLIGNKIWATPLPSGIKSVYSQPPATDNENRVAYVWTNMLFYIVNGEVLWKEPVPRSDYSQYITILGDGSILLASGVRLIHFSSEGTELLNIEIDEGICTSPPVVDDEGRIIVGTTRGVACYR